MATSSFSVLTSSGKLVALTQNQAVRLQNLRLGRKPTDEEVEGLRDAPMDVAGWVAAKLKENNPIRATALG